MSDILQHSRPFTREPLMPNRCKKAAIYFVGWCLLPIALLSRFSAFTSSRADEWPNPPVEIDARLDESVRTQMLRQQMPGLSIAVVREGKVILARGYGYANLDKKSLATPDSVYALGSVTKQFTAAAILLLVEDGKINLHEPVTHYLDDLPAEWSGVTIHHLLTHTSGIRDEEWQGGRPEFSRHEWRQEDVIKTAFGPLDSPPGDKWAYNNAGYRLLGMIIEKTSGRSYWEFLDERIFRKLGMTSTRNSDPKASIRNRAQGYVVNGNSHEMRQPVTPSAAFSEGALMSSVLDLAKWDAALYGETVLENESLEKMWTPVPTLPSTPIYYGYGWFLYKMHGHNVVEHPGAILGFGAYICRFVDDGVTVIVLTNLEDGDCAPIAKTVARFFVPDLASDSSTQPEE